MSETTQPLTRYHWVTCGRPNCEGKFAGRYECSDDFIHAATQAGWNLDGDGAVCPDCQPQAQDNEPPILVVPLPSGGAFTAYCPTTMQPQDWELVQGICAAMAGTRQNLPTPGGC